MASPNTLAIMRAKIALRSKTIISIVTAGSGPNRAARRKEKIGWRLRSKMKPERWAMVWNWKYPKQKRALA